MKTMICDLQEAKRIIDTVGESYQAMAVDMLLSLTYYKSDYEPEKSAQKLIQNITECYMLDLGNILFADNKEEILKQSWILGKEGDE